MWLSQTHILWKMSAPAGTIAIFGPVLRRTSFFPEIKVQRNSMTALVSRHARDNRHRPSPATGTATAPERITSAPPHARGLSRAWRAGLATTGRRQSRRDWRTLGGLQPFFCLALCILFVHEVVARHAQDTIQVSDIRPGMTGFGLTVFRGTQPERFPVKVIDVLHEFRPGQDLVLIRTPHPILDQAKSVAGMSGSPIYLDGKLAGAYAYGWPFGVEPIAGVTPIANMLAELTRPIDPSLWRMLSPLPAGALAAQVPGKRAVTPIAGTSPLPAYRTHETRDALWAVRQWAQLETAHPPGAAEHAYTPLMLSGFSSTASNLLNRELARFGMLSVEAGGTGRATGRSAGAGNSTKSGSYQAGSAIGVQLIRGDVSATAVGTVTHVDGQRLVAFGHPMMNVGQTAMPTTTAEVVHIMAGQQRSFKMSRPLTPKGALVQDRQAAVVIDTTHTPETIPVTLSLAGPVLPPAPTESSQAPRPQSQWQFEVASNRNLTPVLIYSALMNALEAAAADVGNAVFHARSTLQVEGHEPLTFVDVGHVDDGLATASFLAQLRLFSALDATYGNPFERAHVTGVTVDVTVEYTDAVASLVSARVPSRNVLPGQTVPVHLTFRTYNGDTQERMVPLQIPQSAAGQQVNLVVTPGNKVRPPLPVPRNLQDLFDGLQQAYPPTSLVLALQLPSQGVRVPGHVAHQLPGSFVNSLQTESAQGPQALFTDTKITQVPIGNVVYGETQMRLQVLDEARR